MVLCMHGSRQPAQVLSLRPWPTPNARVRLFTCAVAHPASSVRRTTQQPAVEQKSSSSGTRTRDLSRVKRASYHLDHRTLMRLMAATAGVTIRLVRLHRLRRSAAAAAVLGGLDVRVHRHTSSHTQRVAHCGTDSHVLATQATQASHAARNNVLTLIARRSRAVKPHHVKWCMPRLSAFNVCCGIDKKIVPAGLEPATSRV